MVYFLSFLLSQHSSYLGGHCGKLGIGKEKSWVCSDKGAPKKEQCVPWGIKRPSRTPEYFSIKVAWEMFQKNSALQKQAAMGTLVYKGKEEEKLFSPFYHSSYFSQPQDFPQAASHVPEQGTDIRTVKGLDILDIRLLRDCFKEWRCRGLSVSNLTFVSPSESAHETSAAPGSTFWTIPMLKNPKGFCEERGSAVTFYF